MPRNYPKYIYQKVHNATGNGDFIFRTLSPAFLASAGRVKGKVELVILKKYEEASEEEWNLQLQQMQKWFIHSQFVIERKEKGYSIQQAYLEILKIPGLSNILNLSRSTVSNIKKNIEQIGKYPGHDIMDAHLRLCGWAKVEEEKWQALE